MLNVLSTHRTKVRKNGNSVRMVLIGGGEPANDRFYGLNMPNMSHRWGAGVIVNDPPRTLFGSPVFDPGGHMVEVRNQATSPSQVEGIFFLSLFLKEKLRYTLYTTASGTIAPETKKESTLSNGPCQQPDRRLTSLAMHRRSQT